MREWTTKRIERANQAMARWEAHNTETAKTVERVTRERCPLTDEEVERWVETVMTMRQRGIVDKRRQRAEVALTVRLVASSALWSGARLRDAAPDLYKALRGMVEAWEQPLDDETARVEAARAALAKATS